MHSYHEITQGALIERLAQDRPDADALIYPDRGLRMSFKELERRSMALARGLVALGIEPGDRVTLWSDNRPDWVPLQFAIARVGAVLVTANTALARDEIGYLLKQSRSRMVIAAPGVKGDEYLEALEALRETDGAHPELEHHVVIDDAARGNTIRLNDLVQLGQQVPEDEIRALTAKSHPDDRANIQYTSGTTGFPKGVVLTHRNIVENAWTVSGVMEVSESDRLLLQTPLFHCFGCVISVLGAYTHGIPLVALQRFEPRAALSAIDAEGVTLAYGVPTMFAAMLGHPDFAEFDTSSLRAGIMGGAMCPEPLMRRVIDVMGCAGMMTAYGLTEASPAVTMSRLSDPIDARCGSVGRAIDGVSCRVVDPDTGRDVARGETGELWAQGPNIMAGYFEDPEGTSGAIADGRWLRTGDLAREDGQGRYHIVGRIKELIIRGGENVYPAEVEDALRSIEGVVDAAVFGVPSEEWGEEVAAAVVAPTAGDLTQGRLLRALDHKLAHFKRPAHIQFVDELPLTASGKVQKFRLAEQWRSDG